MKRITISLIFTVLLTLVIVYILYPLNYGAVALVFILSYGIVWLVQFILRSANKKTRDVK